MSLEAVAEKYAVAISPAIRNLIVPGDPDDPIARQFLPSEAELVTFDTERADPIGDAAHSPLPGIVHRHRDRVLFKAVAACPVYCRFCFRRAMIGPGSRDALSPQAFDAAMDYIASHPEIWEVILTGGDPFILSARRAAEITARLGAMVHVKIIRWHTRVPVVAPERVTEEFVAALKGDFAASYVALHANHPREFSAEARAAIARLVDAGIPMVSQSVLLRGVNDDVETLEALMRCFVENRIKPYYLHHPDLAPGTSHFRLDIEEGLALVRALRVRISGLAMPAYMLDIPGGFGKVLLDSTHVEKTPDGHRIRDSGGAWHIYPPAI